MAPERAEIEALVRRVVTRTLGTSESRRTRPVLDEATIRATETGTTLSIPADALITPLAREIARERKITLDLIPPTHLGQPAPVVGIRADKRPLIAIGADHGGYDLKELLKKALAADYQIVDCGTHSKDPVDYPDIAVAVARLVASGEAWRGIVIDGAGIGSCMAANKVRGVRAAMCYDNSTAVNSREHNNANVLTLGAGLIGPSLAQQIVHIWLTTDFGGGRHAKRVAKIDALDGLQSASTVSETIKKETPSRPPAY